MNERNINNYALNEKISNFKKKYTDLLMQLDSSALLNLSKFENFENFQGDSNLFSLLKENEKVSNNLKLIKESIRNKILNLQMLSAKTNDKDLMDLYGNMYDFDVLNDVPTYYETPSTFSKSQMQKVMSDIDSAMSKIEEMSDFIETKVIPKISEAENENKSLTTLLNDSQKKIKELIIEKDIDQQTIAKLDASNKEWESEFNKLVDLWVDLNQKFISLDALIVENEKTNKEVSEEKDKLIKRLENKLNELLTDLDSSESFVFKDFNNVYKITDAFTNLLNKIFTESFKYVYSLENDYYGKIKDFNKKRDLLISEFNKSIKRRDKNVLLAELSQEDSIDDLKDEIAIFSKQLNHVKKMEDLKGFLNKNFITNFEKILTNLKVLSTKFHEVISEQGNLFSNRSVRRINNFINQLNTYYEKINIFKEQVLSFLEVLNSFDQITSFNMITFHEYWANACYAFTMIDHKLKKDFLVIEKILKIFIYFLNSNDSQFINFEEEFKKIVDESIKDSKNIPSENLISYQNKNVATVNEVVNNLIDDSVESFETQVNSFNPSDVNIDFESNNKPLTHTNINQDVDFIYMPDKNVEFIPNDSKDTSNFNYESDVKDFAKNLEKNDSNKFIDLGTIDNNDSDEFIFSFNNSPSVMNEINYVSEKQQNLKKQKNNNDIVFEMTSEHLEPLKNSYDVKSFESLVQKFEKDEDYYDAETPEKTVHSLFGEINNVELIDDKLSLLSENDEINNDVDNQINDFYSFSRKILRELEFKSDLSIDKRISCKNSLYNILSDEQTTVREKIEKIELFLLNVFKNDYYNKSFYYWIVVFKNYLLEKKYNINLKLRIVKTKLSKMKILLELEREKNYLSLFE